MAKAAPTRKLSQIKYITIHHSAVQPGAMNLPTLKRRARSYDTSHSKRPWAIYTGGEKGYKYISYHYLLGRDGSKLQVQQIKYMRYHASDWANGKTSHNQWGIAICLDGNYVNEKPTAKERAALVDLITRLERQLGKKLVIKGHKEVSLTGTSCPGNRIGTSKSGWLAGVIKTVHAPKPPVDPCAEKVKGLENRLETSMNTIRDLKSDAKKTEEDHNSYRTIQAEKMVELRNQVSARNTSIKSKNTKIKDQTDEIEALKEELKPHQEKARKLEGVKSALKKILKMLTFGEAE